MAFAVGAYLPLELSTTSFLGALIAYIFAKREALPDGDGDDDGANDPDAVKPNEDESAAAVLFAGGLITGESLVGVILAIPIVISNDPEVLKVVSDPQQWPCAFFVVALAGAMSYYARSSN
jgi:uncharacterized oligopeptide transporter (OPT) family protein